MALGGRIEIDVVPNLNNFERELRSGLQRSGSLAGTAGKTIGVALAAGTAIAAVGFKQVIDLGIEFQSNLNNLQAVSHATDAQMAQVAATAQRLGSDLSLPATSAADAAQAMLELSKGGLTVDQSMTAAKGTLQLAAAAQVDGAKAAEIQANALNAFGLSADNAGHVADVLANASNAASGEITDFAQALQAVGAVSHQFGISLDDTVTALGLFANAGIKGSDAGTLLKSSLLALANPSKPAARAMETLGLKAFDATGKFVGLESIFGQLRAASQRLTPEMYAQAAATVFGSDAVRLAGIAANTTGEQWDQMADSVSKAGGAQEVAAAKMKGLGGALQGLNSQIETSELQIFDAIKGPLEQAVRAATDLVPKIGDGIASGIRVAVAVGETVGPLLAAKITAGAGAVLDAGRRIVSPFTDAVVTGIGIGLQTAESVLGSFGDVARNTVDAVTPVAEGLGHLADAAVAGDGPLRAAAATLGVIGQGAALASGLLVPLGSIVGGLVSGFADLPGPIQSVVFAMLALRFAGPLLSGLGSAFTTVTQNTGIFGRAISGLTSPVRAFGTGVASAVASSRAMSVENARTAATLENTIRGYSGVSAAAAGMGRGIAGSVQAVRQFGGEMRTQGALANGFGYNLSTLEKAQSAYRVSTIGAVAATRGFADQVSQIRAGAAGAGQPISTMGAAMRALGENVPLLDRMGTAFTTAAAGATTFGRTAGVAAAAATGIRGVVGGLVGALGGPFGLAITGAVIGLGLWQAANQSAQQAAAEHQAIVSSLADALKASGGAFNQQARELLAASAQFKEAAAGLESIGIASDGLLNAVTQGGPALDRYRAQLQAIIDANTSTQELEGGGFANILNETGQAALDQKNKLDALVGTVGDARKSYEDFTKAVGEQGASLINGAQAGSTLKAAIGVLGDAAASADAKVRALNDALDALSGGQVSAEKANAQLNESLEKIGPAFTEAAKGAKSAKTGLLDTSGAINTTTESGRNLLTATTDLRSNMLSSAEAAFQAAGGYGNLAPATKAASDAAQRSHDAFIEAARAAGLNADQAELLARRYGLVPTDVVTLVRAQGLDQVGQEILGIKTKFDQVPNEKSITVQALSADAEGKLRELGFTVEHLPNGQVLITAPTDQAKAQLATFLAFASGQVSIVKIDGDPNPATGKITATVQLGNGQTATMTYDANPSPADGKIHGTVDLGNGQTATITLDGNPDPATGKINGVVSYGNNQTANIKVDAPNVGSVNSAINNAARDRTSHISIITAYQTAHRAIGAITTPGPVTSPAYMAAGGLRQPLRMSAYRAEIVPPNQPRIIGDRQIDDEAFIPINRSGRSHAIFEETARRMGYAVARMYAAGGVAATRGADMTAIAALRSSSGSPDVVAAVNGLAARLGAVERGVQVTNQFFTESSARESDAVARVQRRQAALGLFG